MNSQTPLKKFNQALSKKLNPAEQKVHEQFVWCGKNAKEWTEQCKWLLLEVEEMKIWKKLGFECVYHYAAALAGMSRYAAEDALWILRKLVDKPILREVAKEKGLAAVRPVLTVVTSETEEFWAEKARSMTKNTLEMYVKEFKKQAEEKEREQAANRLASCPRTTVQSENCTTIPTTTEPTTTQATIQPLFEEPTSIQSKILTITLDPEIASELLKLKGQGDWNSLVKELLELRRAKLEVEKPEPVRTDSRAIPAKIERYCVAKTRGQCGYPDCTKPYKILHHTQRWALDHVHDPDKIIPLCVAHERIAHQGLIENEEKPTNEWKVREEPVWWDLKYSIDQQVMAYRMS